MSMFTYLTCGGGNTDTRVYSVPGADLHINFYYMETTEAS